MDSVQFDLDEMAEWCRNNKIDMFGGDEAGQSGDNSSLNEQDLTGGHELPQFDESLGYEGLDFGPFDNYDPNEFLLPGQPEGVDEYTQTAPPTSGADDDNSLRRLEVDTFPENETSEQNLAPEYTSPSEEGQSPGKCSAHSTVPESASGAHNPLLRVQQFNNSEHWEGHLPELAVNEHVSSHFEGSHLLRQDVAASRNRNIEVAAPAGEASRTSSPPYEYPLLDPQQQQAPYYNGFAVWGTEATPERQNILTDHQALVIAHNQAVADGLMAQIRAGNVYQTFPMDFMDQNAVENGIQYLQTILGSQNAPGNAYQALPNAATTQNNVENVYNPAQSLMLSQASSAPVALMAPMAAPSRAARPAPQASHRQIGREKRKEENMAADKKYTQYGPQIPAWGPPNNAELFQYVQEKTRLVWREYSAEQLRYYIERNPRALRLWLQQMPAHRNDRMERDDRRCRYLNCPANNKTILAGWLRVAFDEFPDDTTHGYRDPYKVACSMHLWCFEQCFDPAEWISPGHRQLCADTRVHGKEPEGPNPMGLNRDDRNIVEEAFNPWYANHQNDYMPNGYLANRPNPWIPRAHGQTLSYELVMHHLDKQVNARQTTRTKRNNKRNKPAKTIDVHVGDLALHSSLASEEASEPAAKKQRRS